MVLKEVMICWVSLFWFWYIIGWCCPTECCCFCFCFCFSHTRGLSLGIRSPVGVLLCVNISRRMFCRGCCWWLWWRRKRWLKSHLHTQTFPPILDGLLKCPEPKVKSDNRSLHHDLSQTIKGIPARLSHSNYCQYFLFFEDPKNVSVLFLLISSSLQAKVLEALLNGAPAIK